MINDEICDPPEEFRINPNKKLKDVTVTNNIFQISPVFNFDKLKLDFHKADSIKYYEKRRNEMYNSYNDSSFISTLQRLLDNTKIMNWVLGKKNDDTNYCFLQISLNNELFLSYKIIDNLSKPEGSILISNKKIHVNLNDDKINKIYRIAGDLEIDSDIIFRIVWLFYSIFIFHVTDFRTIMYINKRFYGPNYYMLTRGYYDNGIFIFNEYSKN